MKIICLAFSVLGLAALASAQVNLNATALLSDEAGNAATGVTVEFNVEASGAVYTAEESTDESGVAAVSFELPSGTMQGMVNATYMNCDSVMSTMTASFSANALGGLSDVFLAGVYCGGEVNPCNMSLDGGQTVMGSWMFAVAGAPENATYDWTVDGVTMNNTNDSNFGWEFEGESVWTVCVEVISADCEPWTDCYEVDTTNPTGGENCELSFEVVQSVDEAGDLIPGSLDVIVPELSGQPTYEWDFGDEGTSTEASPTYTYAGNGPYLLCLTAAWGDSLLCTATYCDSVSVDDDGFINFLEGFTIHVVTEGGFNGMWETPTQVDLISPLVYPNPVQQGETIAWIQSPAWYRLVLRDGMGRIVQDEACGNFRGEMTMTTAGLAPGAYSLHWFSARGIQSTQLIVQ